MKSTNIRPDGSRFLTVILDSGAIYEFDRWDGVYRRFSRPPFDFAWSHYTRATVFKKQLKIVKPSTTVSIAGSVTRVIAEVLH